MPVLLLKSDFSVTQEVWQDSLRARRSDLEIRCWPDVGNTAEIDFVLSWKMPPELFTGMRNLQAIFSVGAGVDHLLAYQELLPAGIPIIRMVDPSLTIGMTEYVVYHCLRYSRCFNLYERQQQQRQWREILQRPTSDFTVGIMGLGQIGSACASRLIDLGYDVAGWSRTARQLENVRCFTGRHELQAFLAESRILVCLLPLTDETRAILNRRCFCDLPQGAFLINVARGEHLVETDLLQALDSGQIRAATLDVFTEEPLPADHAFWQHQAITMTPHIASLTNPVTASGYIIQQIEKIESGEQPDNQVNFDHQY